MKPQSCNKKKKPQQRSNLIVIGNPFTQQQVCVCICAKPPSLCTICAHGEGGVSALHLICCVVASSCVVRELNKHRTRCARVPCRDSRHFILKNPNRTEGESDLLSVKIRTKKYDENDHPLVIFPGSR